MTDPQSPPPLAAEAQADLAKVAEIRASLDCGDNSCHYARDKGGMRTNGGCRCLDLVGGRSAVKAAYDMLPEVLYWRRLSAASSSLLPAVRELVEAANALRNETRGTLRAHEIAIRYDHGNSNWKCLEMALDMVDAALSRVRAALPGGSK